MLGAVIGGAIYGIFWDEFDRTSRGWAAAISIGVGAGALAVHVVRWLVSTFSGWDWVLPVGLALAVTSFYVLAEYRRRPVYARSTTAAVLQIMVGPAVAVALLIIGQQAGLAVPNVDYVAVAALGGMVGVAELVSRYRDAPTRALLTIPATLYVAINAAAALAALAVAFAIRPLEVQGVPANSLHWAEVTIAGLGAMTILRSSVFNVRNDEQNIAIGPAALLQTLMDSTDRSLARLRGEERAWTVARVMDNFMMPIRMIVSDRYATRRGQTAKIAEDVFKTELSKALTMLPRYCISLTPNLSTKDEEEFLERTKKICADTELTERVRLLSVGLVAMDIVGSGVLEAAVISLAEDVRIKTWDASATTQNGRNRVRPDRVTNSTGQKPRSPSQGHSEPTVASTESNETTAAAAVEQQIEAPVTENEVSVAEKIADASAEDTQEAHNEKTS